MSAFTDQQTQRPQFSHLKKYNLLHQKIQFTSPDCMPAKHSKRYMKCWARLFLPTTCFISGSLVQNPLFLAYFCNYFYFAVQFKILPMRTLTNHAFPKCTPPPPRLSEQALKHRKSMSRGVTSLLAEIKELSKEQIPSVATNFDIYSRVDAKTLQKIKTYKNLDLPCLKDMDEEECLDRYMKDPFFHKKLEYQFEYLDRLRLKSKVVGAQEDLQNVQPKGLAQLKSNNIKFKDVLLQDQRLRLEEKKKYENVLKRVSSREQFQSDLTF